MNLKAPQHESSTSVVAPPDLDRDQLRSQFAEQGYTILRGFFDTEIIHEARNGLDKLVDREAQKLIHAGKIQEGLIDEPFETRLARLYEGRLGEAPLRFKEDLHLAELFPIFFHRDLLNVVELLLGSEILLYPNYTVRPKMPGYKKHEVLWHQDGGYTEAIKTDANVSALRMVNVWSPLVPAHEEHGCMQFIPGSHKLGSVPHAPHPQFKWLEIAPEYLQPRLDQAVTMELDPGDVVLFHNLLFHQGLPNRSKIIRWTLDWRYLDASQSTMRAKKGHMARSRRNPSSAVQSAGQWETLTFS